MESSALSNVQMELLKLYSKDIPDTQLNEIKILLSDYFANKVSDELDILWKDNKWNDETMNQWANEHNRSKGRN